MKVLLINGSPKGNGCTYTALNVISDELKEIGIETEIINVGNKPIRGCIGCGMCAKSGTGKCQFGDDGVNAAIDACKTADAIIVGTPVHYAAASGAITSFMDRLFYAGSSNLVHKPGAVIASCRRGGSTATLDQLSKYFSINNMPIVTSSYWNMVHGNTPEETLQDKEGIQTMQNLAKNMAWLLKSIEAGKKSGIEVPDCKPKVKTNFIR